MIGRDIIVIGASAGGFDALQRLAAQLPATLPASIFITMHLAAGSNGILPDRLNKAGALPAANAGDGDRIERGRIYIAPPDYHMAIAPGYVRLNHGPRENLQRPCINVMFRSAAGAYGPRVIGVLLTGMLDDGVAGLWEIQQEGGTTVVQNPEDAAFRGMPTNAIRGLNVQYIIRLDEMGSLLTRLTMSNEHLQPASPAPPAAEPAGQSCPECGGVMTLTHMGSLLEYRCHIGHRFGLRTMIEQKSRLVEHALGVALAQSEELAALLDRLSATALPDELPKIREEIAIRRRQQETLRELNRGRTGPAAGTSATAHPE